MVEVRNRTGEGPVLVVFRSDDTQAAGVSTGLRNSVRSSVGGGMGATVAVQFVRDDEIACGFGLEARSTPSVSSAGDPPQLLNTTGMHADWHGLHEWAPIDAAGRASLRVANAARHDVSVAKLGLFGVNRRAHWPDVVLHAPGETGGTVRLRVKRGELE